MVLVVWLVIGALALGVAAYSVLVTQRKSRAKLLIKNSPVHTMPGLPIIGNLIQMYNLRTTEKMWTFLHENGRHHPGGFFLWLGHIPWFAVQDTNVIQAILASQDAVQKSPTYQILKPLTEGIFIAKIDKWRKLRKKLNPMFSSRLLENYIQDMNDEARILLDEIKTLENKEINIQRLFERMFLDITSKTLLGFSTDDQRMKRDLIHEASMGIETLIATRMFCPWYYPEWVFKWTKAAKGVIKTRKKLISFAKKWVEDAGMLASVDSSGHVELQPGKSKHGVTYTEHISYVLKEMNMEVTFANLTINATDLAMAGSDTGATAISELFYRLSQHPIIQQKVFEEVLSVYGEERFKELTKEDLSKLTYLEMAIKEALRFSAPPGIIRELQSDLNVGEFVIPQGTNIYILMKAIHMNPIYYEKPNQFYPEHFLPENIKKRPKEAFMPFSLGPRNCPGYKFAYNMIKLTTSAIIRNYKIQSDLPEDKVCYKMILMQEIKGGYPIKLIPRE